MDMEPTRYIIAILMITNTNASSLENATLNSSGLNNFNQMIDKLIAETESTVIAPTENKNVNEPPKEESTPKLSNNGQGIPLTNEKYTDLILDNKHNEESSMDTNRDWLINNFNTKQNDSNIIYINKTLPHNLTLADKLEIARIANNFPEFPQSRRSFSDNAEYEEMFNKILGKPLSDDQKGIVVKEEFSFEIEDDKPIHVPTTSEHMHYNNTLHEISTPPALPFHDDHVQNDPFNQPPLTTHTNNETDLRAGKPPALEKVMTPIPYHQEHSNKLLTELSKISAKINGVEDLLKKSIVKKNEGTHHRRLAQNPELVKSEKSIGLLRTSNPQVVVPYQSMIYRPALQSSIAASSVLSLQERLIEERARNHLLNLQLAKVARAKQNVALLNELIRARSRLTLRLPPVYRRILL
ncbi:uncharacterized protein [Choristoneura fumiferana]|uniref:uncharacterized protein n=1 Tax=Choristoneura fumiferana TaxID=7141 RepID=UPI003D155BF9